jgi:hypothetical protein
LCGEEFGGGAVGFERGAVEAAGDEIAVGVVAAAGAGDDVIEDAIAEAEGAGAVEAAVAVAGVDGGTESGDAVEAECGGRSGGARSAGGRGQTTGNFGGKKDAEAEAGAAAFEDANEAEAVEGGEGAANGPAIQPEGAGELRNGEAEFGEAGEAGEAQKMKVGDADGGMKLEARDTVGFDVGPEPGGAPQEIAGSRRRTRRQGEGRAGAGEKKKSPERESPGDSVSLISV